MTLLVAIACSLTGCASTGQPVRRDDILYLKPGGATQHQVIAAHVAPSRSRVDPISMASSPAKQQHAGSI
jgi:hypothetical protein